MIGANYRVRFKRDARKETGRIPKLTIRRLPIRPFPPFPYFVRCISFPISTSDSMGCNFNYIARGGAGQLRRGCLHGTLFLLKEGSASTRYVRGLGSIPMARKSDNSRQPWFLHYTSPVLCKWEIAFLGTEEEVRLKWRAL